MSTSFRDFVRQLEESQTPVNAGERIRELEAEIKQVEDTIRKHDDDRSYIKSGRYDKDHNRLNYLRGELNKIKHRQQPGNRKKIAAAKTAHHAGIAAKDQAERQYRDELNKKQEEIRKKTFADLTNKPATTKVDAKTALQNQIDAIKQKQYTPKKPQGWSFE